MVVVGCMSACARVDGCARVEKTDYDYQWPSLVNRRGGSSDVFSFCISLWVVTVQFRALQKKYGQKHLEKVGAS